MYKQLWIGSLLMVGAVCLILIATRSPDLAAWPRYAAFRCRECGGAAHIDFNSRQCWGCQTCR